MTQLEQKLAKAMTIVRVVWLIFMAVSFCYTVFFLPAFYILLWVPFVAIGYLLLLLIVAFAMSGQITEEAVKEIEDDRKLRAVKEKLASGKHTPEETMKLMQEAGITDVAVVEETSDVIGSYQGREIFEWVLVKSPNINKAAKFLYHGPAEVQRGMPIIPTIPGLLFTCVNGVLYYIEVEPDQTNVQQPNPSV